MIPIYDIAASIRVEGTATSVKLAPQGCPLQFTQEGDRVSFTLPVVKGHQMAEVGVE